MSQPLPDVPVVLPLPARRPRSVAPGTDRADALLHLSALSHYLPDYAYRPDRHQYTETETTDPHYVVLGVRMMMSPTFQHGECVAQMGTALKVLTRSVATQVHVSADVQISGIPTAFFTSDRHTSNLRPDLALWPHPRPSRDVSSYGYDRDGVPLLVVEVVSHSDQEQQDNDWRHKMAAYAHMGIREYWIVDQRKLPPLWGYTLDAADGTPYRLTTYRLIEADAEGGMDSMVLDTSMRWAQGGVECWYALLETWVPVEDIPVLEGKLEGKLEVWGHMLHRLLDTVAPEAADQVLQCWSERPPDTWPSNETLDRLESAPGDWRQLLLGETSPPRTAWPGPGSSK